LSLEGEILGRSKKLKRANVKPATQTIAPADLLREWLRQLQIIREELRSLTTGAQVFWEVQRILADNRDALSHRLFNDWISTNYAVATAVGIRRQLDRDPRAVSLQNLLTRIQEAMSGCPDILSRASFVETFRRRFGRDANATFDELVGSAKMAVDCACVQRDIDQLQRLSKLKTWVDKRIAHRDSDETEKRMLGELDEGLNLLLRLLDRYSMLLTGLSSGIGPTLPNDWKSVFKIAWLPDFSDDDG
jgi:hypothetical protein